MRSPRSFCLRAAALPAIRALPGDGDRRLVEVLKVGERDGELQGNTREGVRAAGRADRRGGARVDSCRHRAR